MTRLRNTLLLLALAASAPRGLAAQAARSAPRADLIVTGGRIYTVDATRPMAEAFAVRGGRFVFVGSTRGAMTLKGPATRILDLHGAAAYPGFIDAHAHLLGLGGALRSVDLVGVTSYDEVVSRVVARAKSTPPGQWITGNGWDQNRWPTKEFPSNDALTKAVPNNPVVLDRVDGHAVLANAAAMRAAGITAKTPDPAGGRIIHDAKGNPTGVFVDNAMSLVASAEPRLTAAQERELLHAAAVESNRWGLTEVQDMGAGRSTIEALESLARERKLPLRTYEMVSDDSADLAYFYKRGPQKGLYDAHVWVRGIKLYADGALGSRGAALLAPYSDDSTNRGLLVSTREHLRERSIEALRHGFQISTHAIGDRGNRNALDAYQAALDAVPTADARLRVEHAQIISPQDIPRFAQLGVIPSMQASHQTSDMPWAERRLGPERIHGAYAWRSLLNTGVVIPNGTDFPVEHVNPIITFHSSVTRQDAENAPPGGWYGDQRMTRAEALRSMTLWPAYAAFQENELGSIAPGKYADFTILNRDIMTVAPEKILGAQVIATYVGGAAVFEAKASEVSEAERDADDGGRDGGHEGARAMPLQREEEWTHGLVARDPKVFERLLAPGFVYTENVGVMSRDDVIASAFGDDTTAWAGNEGMKVHDFGSTQLITGVLHVKGRNKSGPFDRRYAFTDTWQDRDGTWLLIGAQDYVIP
ncbi:MAG: amidohydrolase family protein [Gemmatimonadaceae bacterium]|nr:amidohydrolase family protein [Gemmatimonadaceae bacterium]